MMPTGEVGVEQRDGQDYPVNSYVRLRIRRIRLERGLRSQEVARRACIPASSYSCLENGRYCINLERLLCILLILEADISEVFPRQPSDLLAPLPPPEPGVGFEDVMDAVSHVAKGAKKGIAAELVAEEGQLTLQGLGEFMGCHVTTLSHARRRLRERLPSCQPLRQQLDNAHQKLKRRKNEIRPAKANQEKTAPCPRTESIASLPPRSA